LPLWMRDADDRRFFYGGMAHEGVFEIDGADPLAAGFYEILGAVDDLDEALVVHVGDVSGAEPAVGGPAVGLVGGIVVATGNPWCAPGVSPSRGASIILPSDSSSGFCGRITRSSTKGVGQPCLLRTSYCAS